MKWVRRLSFCAVILLVPGVMLSGAVNLVIRMPDFYQFEFNRVNLEQELSLSVEQGELAETLSAYMWGREKQLILEQENENTEKMENIFSPEEEEILARKREQLNLCSLGMGAAVVLLAAAYFALLRGGAKVGLRRAFLLSIPAGLIYTGILGSGLFVQGAPAVLKAFYLQPAFPEESVLASVFTVSFVRNMAAASAAITAVGLLVLGMVTWSLTKPYHMFRRENRGRKA